MLNHTLKRSILDTRLPLSTLPPTFLLPLRARLFNTSTPYIDETTPTSPPPPFIEGESRNENRSLDQSFSYRQPRSSTRGYAPNGSEPVVVLPDSGSNLAIHPQSLHSSSPTIPTISATASDLPGPLTESVKTLLPLLRAQTPHYVTIHIHGRPYLLTAGDVVRLPFLMSGVLPGDMLRLNRATHLGSREYTLKGAPYVDERLFVCRARVMGVEAEPMRIKEKTKRRQRHVKTVRSKHKFTILRVTEVNIRSVDEVEADVDKERLAANSENVIV